MVIKIPYQDGKCPHCGASLGSVVKDAYIYGSLIRNCTKCKNPYLDKRYHEIEIDGIREGDLSTKGNGKMILGCLVAAIVLFALNAFTILTLGRIYTAIFLMFLLFVFFFFAMIVETVKVKSGKKEKELEVERHVSVKRLQNKEYAHILLELGYKVPEKYL